MIHPTVGRIVWFHEAPHVYAAIVCRVWTERMVNLCVFALDGHPHGRTSVPLLQDDDRPPEKGCWCEWMPYQKGQAARTDELEKQITKGG